MRITNNSILQDQLTAIRANAAALDKATKRASTGLRFQTAAEDPSAASSVMATQSSLRALDQYKANVGRASSRVQAEDTALGQINDLITRAKELGIMQATDTANTQSRVTAGAELQQIFQQIVSIANTKFGNEYLFGGSQSTTQPFTATGTGANTAYSSTTPQGQRSVEIGAKQSVAVGHDGTQVFVSTGLLDAVRDLTHSMDPASPIYGKSGITSAVTALDGAFDSLQAIVGEVGAREGELSTAAQNLDAFKTNLTAQWSDLQDVDLETAVTELTTRQNAYQAAMLATSKVLSSTLTDYLR